MFSQECNRVKVTRDSTDVEVKRLNVNNKLYPFKKVSTPTFTENVVIDDHIFGEPLPLSRESRNLRGTVAGIGECVTIY